MNDNSVSIKSIALIQKSIIIDYSQRNISSILSNFEKINRFLLSIDHPGLKIIL